MPAYTKAEAESELVTWKAALKAIAGGQSYTLPDGQSMTKANLPEVRGMVEYFGNQVDRLTRGSMRTYHVIPLDS